MGGVGWAALPQGLMSWALWAPRHVRSNRPRARWPKKKCKFRQVKYHCRYQSLFMFHQVQGLACIDHDASYMKSKPEETRLGVRLRLTILTPCARLRRLECDRGLFRCLNTVLQG